jgi:NADPH2:quinone reductase
VKAIRFHSHGGPEVLRLDDIPAPVARPGEAPVRVRNAGVNAADICQRTGVTPTALPPIGGLEGVGIVETSAGGLPAGTRVMWTPPPGAHAEFVAVPVWKFLLQMADRRPFTSGASKFKTQTTPSGSN